jgi:hypothetical protein
MSAITVLVDTGPTVLTKTWYVDGTATDVGDITIGIVDLDGTEIVAPLTGTTNNNDGTYTYSLAVQADVNELVATWTAGGQALVDEIHIIGGRLFTEAELRAHYDADLSDDTVYTDPLLAEARDRITAEFERICEVAFVPTYRRETLRGSGGRTLYLERSKISSVIAASIGSIAQTAANIVPDPSLSKVFHTTRSWNWPTGSDPYNVTISYVHGHGTVPPDIKRAAMILARMQLLKDVTGQGVPEQASQFTDPTGQYVSFGANDMNGRWYGVPVVDSVLRDYSLRIPVTSL